MGDFSASTVWRSPLRDYREYCAIRTGEVRFRVCVDESDLLVTSTKDHSAEVEGLVRSLRGQLRNWILLHPEFRSALKPIPIPEKAPDIVRRMCAGSIPAGVGPFAAVAGTIAQFVAERLATEHGLTDVLVENGGDLFLHSSVDRVIGLLPEPASGILIGVKIRAMDCPLSLCASSGRIGHSLSFGHGDLAVALARDAALADAAATAFGNMLHEPEDVSRVIHRARSMQSDGIEGVFVQCGGKVGLWGLELAEAAST